MAIDIIARGMIEDSNGNISQLSEKVSNHTDDSDIHVTVSDKKNWNSHPNDVQASGNPVQIDGLQGGVPFSEMVVSGKNLMPFPYYDGNSKTHNGITFTVNADGSVTANGTATAAAIFYISTDFTIKKGMYALSGCPKSNSNTDYVLQFATGDWSFKISDFGNGATAQINNDINLQIFRIAIPSGIVCDNVVFRPQLEFGSTATAYEPPITGRELTVNVNGTEYTITPDSNPYTVPIDIIQQDGINNITVSEGELSVSGVRKNEAIKKIWDDMGMDLLFDGVTTADNPAVIDLANYKFVEIHHIMIANEKTYPANIRLSLDSYLSSASTITIPIVSSAINTIHTEEGTVSSLYAISAAGGNMNNTKIYGIK